MFWSPIPTTDLYFLNSSRDLVAQHPWQQRPVKRIGNNTFQCGNRFLVIRRDKENILRKVLTHRQAEIVYLVDDNIWGAPEDTSLPEAYRQRLKALQQGPVSDIFNRASRIVVSCSVLRDTLSVNKPVDIVHPCWQTAPPDSRHFDSRTVRLVHLGTNSHLAGLRFLIPVLETVLNATSNATFTYFSNTPLLGSLDGNTKVSRHPLLSWSKYKKQIGRGLYHLGLYPIVKTPFNSSRSHNKILEYTLAGCAAVYSEDWSHTRLLTTDVNCWVCPNDVEQWIHTLCRLIGDTTALRSVYTGSSVLYLKLNDLISQRKFWEHVLLG